MNLPDMSSIVRLIIFVAIAYGVRSILRHKPWRRVSSWVRRG